MNIHLLRHAIAADRDAVRYSDDRLRPLTAHGKQQARAVAKAMRHLDLGIDLIWTSPLVRTLQTATPVAKRLGMQDRLIECQALAPDGDEGKLIKQIAALDPQPGNLLLVGHEPYLSELLSVLTSGRPTMQVKMKKGGLAKLQVNGPLRLKQCATLQWLLPPALLVMAG